MAETEFSTQWEPTTRVLVVRVTGVLTEAHVRAWERGLLTACRQIPPTGPFKALVDIRGYEVGEQDPKVHQLQRVVVPTVLARHGFEVGYFRFLDVVNTITPDPGLPQCVAVANVHHDPGKIDRYNETLGRACERFFTDRSEADDWLLAACNNP